MIRAKFEQTEGGKALALTVDGHAHYDDVGKDIVCASASILAYTVAQSVKSMHDRGLLKKKPTIKLKDGDACVVCKPSKSGTVEANYAYHFAQVGFALLAHNYPDFVRVKLFGDADGGVEDK